MATLGVPQTVPSPAEDSERLRKAFLGFGTDEKAIISILAHRNAAQRRRIRETYIEAYGEDLLKSLDKEISGDFERAVLLWTLDPAERDALLAYDAVRNWQPGNRVLVEIACTRSAGELFAVRLAYQARYKRSLEEDVAVHTKGDYRKLLLLLLMTYRYEGQEVNMSLAKSEAKIIHKAISNMSCNDDEIIRILGTRSKAQLTATFNQYKNEFGIPISKDLGGNSGDEYRAALKAVVKCIVCPARYLERVVRLAVEGLLGTDEDSLTRVVATRAEVDLKEIEEMYAKRNSVPLAQAVSRDTSGDYRAMLLALLGHD